VKKSHTARIKRSLARRIKQGKAGHEFHGAAQPQPKAISPQRRGVRPWERTLPACSGLL